MVRVLASVLAGVLAFQGGLHAAAAWPSPHTLGPFAYVSPAPGSALHPAETNVIVRPGGIVDPATVQEGMIQATGVSSGLHAGTLRLSDDGRTLLFRPSVPFQLGEQVACVIAPGIRTDTAGALPGGQFDFVIAPAPAPAISASAILADEIGAVPHAAGPEGLRGAWAPPAAPAATDTLPGDLPPVVAVVSGRPSEGYLFLCDIRFDDTGYRSHLMALRDDATPFFARGLAGSGYDFKAQENGKITYFDAARGRFYVMNANFAVRDSLECGNGYSTDIHELQLLPDGHALLIAYDLRTLDLSAIVPGGSAQADVIGLVVQELDRSKDVVFEWRSWDHFQITDCVSRPLTGSRVDYVHGNAIELDDDGNLLVSCRHLDEITKISRTTGAILWRMGGVNNEFTFTNDPDHFSQQHSIRRLPNGHLLLFDNGNYHVPARSRAVEYAVDETEKTVTKVWEYRNAPDVYASAMGSVQRLPNGNTVIGWGNTNPTITEVTPEGAEVFEATLPAGVYSYRAFRTPWPPVLPAAVSIASGARIPAARGGVATVLVGGAAFAADSIDAPTVRLAGVAPQGHAPPVAPGAPLQLEFPVDLLLASVPPGSRTLELTGAIVSGERFRGWVEVAIEGTRSIGARMVSPVGAAPIRIAFRSDGASERRVRLAAFDVRGRRLARWGAVADASGIVAWDGRRPDGRALASGIYFVRTEGSALTETARVIIAR